MPLDRIFVCINERVSTIPASRRAESLDFSITDNSDSTPSVARHEARWPHTAELCRYRALRLGRLQQE